MIKKYLPWVIALLYFIIPIDLIPDFILGPGWIDDCLVLGLVLWWVFGRKKSNVKNSHQSTSTEEEQTAPSEEENPYRILGIEKEASPGEIKAAYKSLAARYHPDKVQHLGKEFQELAHKKFVAIQGAYDELMRL